MKPLPTALAGADVHVELDDPRFDLRELGLVLLLDVDFDDTAPASRARARKGGVEDCMCRAHVNAEIAAT